MTTAIKFCDGTGPTCDDGETSQSSIPPSFRGQLLLPGVTPASLSASPGSARAREMTATSGRSCSALLRTTDPLGVCLRMLLGTSAWGSTRCALTWKPSGTRGPLVVPACAVDAPHRRDRVWILAHAGCAPGREGKSAGNVFDRALAERPQASGGPRAPGAHGGAGLLADADGLGRLQGGTGAAGRQGPPLPRRGGSSVANTEGISLRARFRAQEEVGQRWGRSGDGRRQGGSPGGRTDVFPGRSTSASVSEQQCRSFTPEGRTWPAEPGVGRVAHGVPGRVDRLKGLGNAVVPQLAEMFGLAIMAAHDE